MRHLQGAELWHVVEAGDWNTADVVVVQCARRKSKRGMEKEEEDEAEPDVTRQQTCIKYKLYQTRNSNFTYFTF